VIDGVAVWRELTPARERAGGGANPPASNVRPEGGALPPEGGRYTDHGAGSCMIVVATDAPLDSRNLQRLAARAVFALARTGSTYSNGSGDFAIAFSTHPSLRVTSATAPQTRTP
jgi:L-aminopeptidase/D-esterase-like protein